MHYNLESKPEIVNERAADSRLFFNEEFESMALTALSKDLMNASKPIRQSAAIDFMVQVPDAEDEHIYRASFCSDKTQPDAWNWQFLFRREYGSASIIDATISSESSVWNHYTLDHQGSLRSGAEICDPELRLSRFALKSFAAERALTDIDMLMDYKSRLMSQIDKTEAVPRSGLNQKLREARVCAAGIKLFSVGPRSTKFAADSTRKLDYVELPGMVREVIENPDTSIQINYRPTNLERIDRLIDDLSL